MEQEVGIADIISVLTGLIDRCSPCDVFFVLLPIEESESVSLFLCLSLYYLSLMYATWNRKWALPTSSVSSPGSSTGVALAMSSLYFSQSRRASLSVCFFVYPFIICL